ncbi:MAG: hypothetical protein A4S12_04940 [Proteobacteria bacterium SG_bin5]|nr:DUF2236 domain-containing protein [Sphingomonas sp.]OQW43433.1 MAG: hypothetical protein A4S12_04940 [Proteobacteria bacterium SG_bin5]
MVTDALRRALIGEVRALFNDQARGEQPVQRAADPFIPAGSVAWRVHGDVTTMMVGGVAALLLQMLHPGALGGVWDHSDFRRDMRGRLRRTARFIAVTTYGSRASALAAIAHVRGIHAKVGGVQPDGTPYRADDPRLLAWVHVAGSLCFLDAWRRFGTPLSAAEQDAYFADVAPVAEALGAEPVPRTRREAEALLASFRPDLVADHRAREVARIVLAQRAEQLRDVPAAAAQGLIGRAAIDLLPGWARKMHGFTGSGVARPAVDALTLGVAGTLRWAFSAPARA